MKKERIFLFFCILIQSIGFAQQIEPYALRFPNQALLPIENGHLAIEQRESSDKPYYQIIQFYNTPRAEDVVRMKINGIELLEFIDSKSYLVRISDQYDPNTIQPNLIRASFKIPAEMKRGPGLNEILPSEKQETYIVQFAKGMSQTEIFASLTSYELNVVDQSTIEFGMIEVGGALQNIFLLTEEPYCIYADKSYTDEAFRYEAVPHSRSNYLTNENLSDLHGSGVVIGIGDGGKVHPHEDLKGRVTNLSSYGFSNHSTGVSGIIAGYPNINPLIGSGIAYEATIITNNFSDIIRRSPEYIADYDMVLTNNSYGANLGNCAAFGDYNSNSVLADQQMVNYPQLLHIFSAGNDGARTCTPYSQTFATIAGGWQTSKNVLTVGSTSQSDVFSSFSSSGPVHDGRIKPEIMAQGQAVNTTGNTSSYLGSSGTSYSGPAIAGISALLYERYRELYSGQNPDGALIKALLCGTADDFGLVGPDYFWGFGRVHAKHALDALENSQFIESTITDGITNDHTITIPSNALQLKVMVLWSDLPGQPYTAYSLVNDIDLMVKDPSNVDHLPWILDPSINQFDQPAQRGVDHTNNYEQVTIDNPAAGAYQIKLTGFRIPMGNQDYKIVYQIVQPELKITYPIHSEKWGTSTLEYIRWDAPPTENRFTVKYSLDSGSTWVTHSQEVASHRRLFGFLTPDTISEQYIVTISENGTSKMDTQYIPLTLMHIPSGLSVTEKCNSGVELQWNQTDSASAYKVFQLMDHQMEEIGITSDTFFKVKNLNAENQYWWSISAILPSGNESQRALAISSGTLTGDCDYDNDLALVKIVSPLKGRVFSSTALSNSENVTLEIINNDNVAISNFNASYQLESEPEVTEVISDTLDPGEVFTYTFTQQIDVSLVDTFAIKTWVAFTSDTDQSNDTIHTSIIQVQNEPVALPYLVDFETLEIGAVTTHTFSTPGLDRLDLELNGLRARSFAGSTFPSQGSKALTLDAATYNVEGNGFATLTLNFDHLDTSTNDIRINFDWRNHEADTTNNDLDLIWLRGSDTSDWIQAYDIFEHFLSAGELLKERLGITVTELLKDNQQNFSSSFQVRIGNESIYSSDELTQQDGFTIDEILFYEVTNDVKLSAIVSPQSIVCGSNEYQLVTQIENSAANMLPNISINYSLNNGPIVSEFISIEGQSSITDTLSSTISFASYGMQSLDIWISENTDSYKQNDSILDYQIFNFTQIDSFPYLETFEDSNGVYFTSGQNSSWEWGKPQSTNIDHAAEGEFVWATKLIGDHNANELSYLYSPCFKIGTLVAPALSFAHRYLLEIDYDYAWMEYSSDAGHTWSKLGLSGEGLGWYNDPSKIAWNASNNDWESVQIDLPAGLDSIQIRWLLQSDGGVELEGLAIDQVAVYDKVNIYTGTDHDTTIVLNDNNWLNIESPLGKIIAIHPNGQDLGNTSIHTYFFNGSIRNNELSYLSNRNWVIQTENLPTAPVGIRFYIPAEEANSLITENNCDKCMSPSDPFQLVAFQYNGLNEDSLWSNNESNQTLIYQENQIHWVPEANGYYGEIWVSSFSEFWIGTKPLNNIDSICLTLSGIYDDAEETIATGSVDPFHTSLRLGDGEFGRQIGLKFNNVLIPTNSIIESAHLQFTSGAIGFTPTDLNIFAIDGVDITTFSTYNFNISNRATFPSSTNWIVPAWNVIGESDANQKSPNLKYQIQPIINEASWEPNSSLGLVVVGQGLREAISLDGNPTQAAKLLITYSDTCNGNSRLYVDQNAIGENDGTNWANAFVNLHDALTMTESCSSVNEIWVKSGTYQTSQSKHPNHSFSFLSKIKLYGGFDGTELEISDRNLLTNISYLDGELGLAADSTDNATHIISTTSTTDSVYIDGFHIINGYADDAAGFFGDQGGAVQNLTHLHLNKCQLIGNGARTKGSTILNISPTGNMIIEDCIIESTNEVSAIENLFGASIEWRGSNFIRTE